MIIFNESDDCTVRSKKSYYLLTEMYIPNCEESRKKLELFYQFADECKKPM